MAEAQATGIAGTHAKAEVEGTSVRKASHKKNASLASVTVGIILAIALIAGAYAVFTGDRTSTGTFPYITALTIGIILVIASFFAPKKFKQWVLGAGVLLFLLGWVFSPYGIWAKNQIERGGACLAYQDCDVRTGAIPVINNGTLRLGPGQTIEAIFVGQVTVTVPAHHCLQYIPASKFYYDETAGATRSFLTPKSGEPTEVRVHAVPEHRCPY